MSDNLSPEDRRKTMRAVKGKGTRLEKRLWGMLAGMGLKGWKKNVDGVTGKPDVVFAAQRIAVFIDGCFWHGCPRCRRKLPKTNRRYWKRKIERNVELARSHDAQLRRDGWRVVRIWEHEMADMTAVRERIRNAVAPGRLELTENQITKTKQESRRALRQWLDSCTRNGRIARNTIAVGVVALHHLSRECPTSRAAVTSKGGEIKGARSGLGAILEAHSIPRGYLKEVTTRQAHQDGQKLLERLKWGRTLAKLPEHERQAALSELIQTLKGLADEWLKRQNLKVDLDRRQAPTTWVNIIIQNARGRSAGVVEQHLVGAKLARRFTESRIPNHPVHAADTQTERAGDFTVARVVYHVTAAPSREVLQKCAKNAGAGLHPVLLVPRDQENKALVLAQDEGVDKQISILSIENFVAQNIIELASEESKDFFTVLREIVGIYNKRLSQVETDLSLQIEVR